MVVIMKAASSSSTRRIQFQRSSSLPLLAVLLLVVLFGGDVATTAFTTTTTSITDRSITLLFSSLKDPPPSQQQKSSSKDQMKHDIEIMRAEALERLEKLSVQMDEFKRENHSSHTSDSYSSLDSLEGDITTMKTATTAPTVVPQPKKKTKKVESKQETISQKGDDEDETSSVKKVTLAPQQQTQAFESLEPLDVTLLEDTRWKMVFNIHREPGTWMAPSWGASGDKLLFEVVVDFTDEPLLTTTGTDDNNGEGDVIANTNNNINDDFLQGLAGSKVLNVIDAWTFPVGVGAWGIKDSHKKQLTDSDVQSIGRRSIDVQPRGAYKVLPQQGPAGTDIVRLYLDLNEPVYKGTTDADIFCPKGRIYTTAGYFPMDRHEKQKQSMNEYKDSLSKEQHAIAVRHEQLQREMDEDTRLFSFDQIKRMKQMHDLKKEMDKCNVEMQNAKQREPERSQMRTSRNGKIALSREGGVCCKVEKGLAVEYHILGRIELASVEKYDDDHDIDEEGHYHPHDEYEELVHKLHP